MALLVGGGFPQVGQLLHYGVQPAHAERGVEAAALELLQAGDHGGHGGVQVLPQARVSSHAAVVAAHQSVQLPHKNSQASRRQR